MNTIIATKTTTNSYYKPVIGRMEKITFSRYKLEVKNDYEMNHLIAFNKQREKPVFHKEADGMYYNVLHKGQEIPEQLAVKLILTQDYGHTRESVKITRVS